VEATTEARAKVWGEWQAHCRAYGVSPYLDGSDFEEVARVALNFCGKLRQGKRGKPVGAGTVAAGIGGVATQIDLDTDTRPLHRQGTDKYIAPISHMMRGFRNFDPATEKKLACHPDLPKFACEHGYDGVDSPLRQATGDLVVIAFYYLLRVGEYTTKTKRKKKTRTRQFRRRDITFFRYNKNGQLIPLPPNASDEEILSADAATLRISNQKNGHKGACVHHSAIDGSPFACPVRALGRRYIHMRANDKTGKAFICSFWDAAGHGNVTENHIRYAVKFAAKALGYPDRGIPLDRIDTHSLRSGGACALKLAGHDDVEIRKMGRWAPKSQAFLEYIQQQLSTFAKGMATNMSRIATFTNVEGTTAREDLRRSTIF
jgi:hypothetical protein